MVCKFCQIIHAENASGIVARTEQLVVLADYQPIRPGHLQIVPRDHFPYFDDLPPALAGDVVMLGQRIARVLKSIYQVERVGFAFTGADIAHCHAHLIPLHAPEDITSLRFYDVEEPLPKRSLRIDDAALDETASTIRAALEEAGVLGDDA